MRKLAALGAILLGGCAPYKTPTTYVEPTGVSKASVRFVNTTQNGVVFPAIYTKAETCGDRQQLGELLEGEEKTFQVAAGHLTSMTLLWSGRQSQYYCPMTWSFVPEANASYRVAIDAVGSQCHIRVLDVTDATRVQRPKEYRLRAWKRAWTNGGDWCQ